MTQEPDDLTRCRAFNWGNYIPRERWRCKKKARPGHLTCHWHQHWEQRAWLRIEKQQKREEQA